MGLTLNQKIAVAAIVLPIIVTIGIQLLPKDPIIITTPVGMTEDGVKALIENASHKNIQQQTVEEVLRKVEKFFETTQNNELEKFNNYLESAQQNEYKNFNPAIEAFNRGDIKEAIKISEQKLVKQKGVMKGSYENLAQMYNLDLDYSHALTNFKEANRLSGDGEFRNEIIELHLKMGQVDEAELLLIKNVIEDELGLEDGLTVSYAVSVKKLIKVLLLNKKPSDAVAAYKKAMVFFEGDSASGPQAIKLLEEVRPLLSLNGDSLSDKEEDLEQILNRAARIYGKYHYNTVEPRNTLAQFYDANSEYDKAKPLYEDSLEIFKSINDEANHVREGIININYAFNSLYRKDFSEANSAMNDAYKKLGKEHPFIANTLPNAIRVMLNNQEYRFAVNLLEKQRNVLELDRESNAGMLKQVSDAIANLKESAL